jgi:hypothetical protein
MTTACDWCGQGDHDPIKPQDEYARYLADRSKGW